jgi:ribosome assembly protein 1
MDCEILVWKENGEYRLASDLRRPLIMNHESLSVSHFPGGSSSTRRSSMSSPSNVAQLLSSSPDHVRLVTIVAHVDHGKTTLADHLISYATELLSDRLAGKVRFLDFDPEEQRRGITIRTSGIVLSHPVPSLLQQVQPSDDGAPSTITIHLHDSPGHSDFMWEVSTSLLATDSALVVIDVVEGMGARTHQVLRETLARRLVPILVLNKLDRLCTELHLSALEAYAKLRELLEIVNATAAAMVVANEQLDDDHDTNENNTRDSKDADNNHQSIEDLWVFEPAKGNVIFASALYGMGFTVLGLCQSLYQSSMVTIKPRILAPFLFGDFKIVRDDQGRDKVFKWKPPSGHEGATADDDANVPLFAKFALEPLWRILSNCHGSDPSSSGQSPPQHQPALTATSAANQAWLQNIVDDMQIGATGTKTKRPTDGTASASQRVPSNTAELAAFLNQHGAKSGDSITRVVLKRYRPLAHVVLDAVALHGPSPLQAASSDHLQRKRLFRLESPATSTSTHSDAATEFHKKQQRAVYECDPNSTIVVAQVCKFVVTQMAHLQDKELLSGNGHPTSKGPVLLGLTRVLSGTLESDGQYYAIEPKKDGVAASSSSFDDANNVPPPTPRKVRLYLLLGSSYVFVSRVPAGHLCAVLGLEGAVVATPVTICSTGMGLAIGTPESFRRKPQPLVKVQIEPAAAKHAPILKRGLRLLQLSDAGVQVSETPRGETLLSCCGELHLEHSLVDLRTKHLLDEEPIELLVSDPIVDFGESTDWMDREAEQFGAFLEVSYALHSRSGGKCVGVLQSQGRVPPPSRQSSIPPYNEEEGLNSAGYGRARSLLTGRTAAIRIRVVPLVPSVYQAITAGRLEEGDSESEMLLLARALNFPKDLNAKDILAVLMKQCLFVSDVNQAVLVETPALSSGACVVGVVSPSIDAPHHSEVYAPSSNFTESIPDEGVSPNSIGAYTRLSERILKCGFAPTKGDHGPDDGNTAVRMTDRGALAVWRQFMQGSTVAGFQLAIKSGPICEEPVRSVLVVLEGVEVAVKTSGEGDMVKAIEHDGSGAIEWTSVKPLSGGMVVSSIRTGIRCALLTRPSRLVEGVFKLTLHSSVSGLGSLYAVLSKRRGKVIEDSVVDGTDLLLIEAMLPAAEAFGLAPELFGKTSGEVTAPEMVWSHWERLDADPFWIPTSLDEREDYGEVQMAGDASTGVDNPALVYIRKVRHRKGLAVDSSRTIVAAEKQRTMKR